MTIRSVKTNLETSLADVHDLAAVVEWDFSGPKDKQFELHVTRRELKLIAVALTGHQIAQRRFLRA